MGVNKGDPKNFGGAGARPLGCLTPKSTPLPTSVTTANLVIQVKRCVITEIFRKSLTHHVSPFKVTQGHWSRYRSTSQPFTR